MVSQPQPQLDEPQPLHLFLRRVKKPSFSSQPHDGAASQPQDGAASQPQPPRANLALSLAKRPSRSSQPQPLSQLLQLPQPPQAQPATGALETTGAVVTAAGRRGRRGCGGVAAREPRRRD